MASLSQLVCPAPEVIEALIILPSIHPFLDCQASCSILLFFVSLGMYPILKMPLKKNQWNQNKTWSLVNNNMSVLVQWMLQ